MEPTPIPPEIKAQMDAEMKEIYLRASDATDIQKVAMVKRAIIRWDERGYSFSNGVRTDFISFLADLAYILNSRELMAEVDKELGESE